MRASSTTAGISWRSTHSLGCSPVSRRCSGHGAAWRREPRSRASTDNLNAIAAVVIGGASLFGGRGTIIGSVIGTGIIAVLLTGLVLVNVPPFWQEVAVGAILITAVYIDQLRPRAPQQLPAIGRPTSERPRRDEPVAPQEERVPSMTGKRTRRLALALAPIAVLADPGRLRIVLRHRRPASPFGGRERRAARAPRAPRRLGLGESTTRSPTSPAPPASSFYDTLVSGMKRRGRKALGMSVIYQGSPDFAPSAQTPDRRRDLHQAPECADRLAHRSGGDGAGDQHLPERRYPGHHGGYRPVQHLAAHQRDHH